MLIRGYIWVSEIFQINPDVFNGNFLVPTLDIDLEM